ncbi:DUF4214 domain-containing protein [uncultured Sulfitobacter sp.]|uniref:DUF4214 domain-containing protein n=1 Tax=uncultured Sulfitobacter sp. TaxID=191468 RepID=UPI0026382E7D|nr:DUF4214 domain-containing protein [uncultured Sulfitobacter sp.]
MATITETSDALATVGTNYDISFGDEFLGEIESSRERDWIRTELDVGYSYWAQMRGDGTATQLTTNSLRLRDDVGASLAGVSGSGPIVFVTPTELSTYYLDTGGQFSSSLGTYRVTLEREVANSVATVATLGVDSSLSSAIDYNNDRDYYRVELEAGTGYYARMSGDGGAGQITDNRIRLLDDAGTTLESVSGTAPLVFISPDQSGTFYIQAAGQFTSRQGTYALELVSEIAAGVGTSSTIEYSEDPVAITSVVDYSGDSDWFKTTLETGYSYVATVTGDGSGNTLDDPRVTWRTENGAQISTGTGSVSLASVTPSENGTFFVEAEGQFSSDVGGYELEVLREISNGFDTVAFLTPGQTLSSTLEYRSDIDLIRTTMTGGETYVISLKGSETSNPISRSYIEVFNSNGVQVSNLPNSFTGDLSTEFTPDTTGTYFLHVGNSSSISGRSGDYDLTFTKVPVNGDDTANTLTGDAGPDVLNGLGGSDWITGQGGSDRLDGGDDGDFIFGDQFEVNYFSTIGSFSEDSAVFVYRLYVSAFDRVADQEGLAGWVGALERDEVDRLSVANSFVQSAEFQQTYGTLNTAEFVNQMYQNIFDREADSGGFNFWTDALNNQGTSRASMLKSLTESREFRNATNADAALYLRESDPAEWSDDVFRLYRATLDRDPDQTGLLGWTDLLSNGTSFDSVIAGFTNSREFRQTYGDLDNEDFVELLYQNVLDRASDTAGREGWLDVLEGGSSRAEVVRGFSQSREFVADTTDPLTDWMRAQGTDDVIDGGNSVNGVDYLAGGSLSDEFIIRPNTSNTKVLDLEVWDTLNFSTFGFTDKQQVLERLQTSSEIAVANGGVWQGILPDNLNFRDSSGNAFVEFVGISEGGITEDMIQI